MLSEYKYAYTCTSLFLLIKHNVGIRFSRYIIPCLPAVLIVCYVTLYIIM